VAGETPTRLAIRLPHRRWRRNATISSWMASDVGRRGLCGRNDRSMSPAELSASNRFSQLRAVGGQTTAAHTEASGVCPLRIARTIRSQPSRVSRAFLCMFIQSSENRSSFDNFSFLGLARMDSLLRLHT
jgi:hypothetical protein